MKNKYNSITIINIGVRVIIITGTRKKYYSNKVPNRINNYRV